MNVYGDAHMPSLRQRANSGAEFPAHAGLKALEPQALFLLLKEIKITRYVHRAASMPWGFSGGGVAAGPVPHAMLRQRR